MILLHNRHILLATTVHLGHQKVSVKNLNSISIFLYRSFFTNIGSIFLWFVIVNMIFIIKTYRLWVSIPWEFWQGDKNIIHNLYHHKIWYEWLFYHMFSACFYVHWQISIFIGFRLLQRWIHHNLLQSCDRYALKKQNEFLER